MANIGHLISTRLILYRSYVVQLASVEKMIKKLELFMTASGEFLGEINAIGGTEVAASFWVTSQNSKLMNLSLVWGTQKP